MRKAAVFLLFLLMIPLISAARPESQTSLSDAGFTILYPKFNAIPLNTNFSFFVQVSNISNGKNVNYSDCYVFLYGNQGEEILDDQLILSSNGWTYEGVIAAGNHTMKGINSFSVYCDAGTEGGAANGAYYVTTYGAEPASEIVTILIYLSFIVVTILSISMIVLTIFKLATASETIMGVLSSWSVFLLLLITNYLAKAYLLDYFIENLTEQGLVYAGWALVILPVIAIFITIFRKSTKKKKLVTIADITGRSVLNG